MNIIKLTNEQLNNLKVFLKRVDLKGFEAEYFVNILQSLANVEEEQLNG